MSYFRLLDAGRQFFDDSGNVLNGGKLYTYEAGTTTNKATYQDNAGASAHANPIILDSAGRVSAEVWGTTGNYKFRLDDSTDSTVWTRDNITGINDTAAASASEWIDSGLTPTYVDGTSFTFAGNQTTVFHVGRRMKITDSGGTVYATITASSYSDPNTTITTSETIDSGISAVSYGIIGITNSSWALPANGCSFRAVRDANQSINDSTDVKIQFNSEVFDVGGVYDDTTNYVFTAPAAGEYVFVAVLALDALAANDVCLLTINSSDYNSGDAVSVSKVQIPGTTTILLSCSAMVQLTNTATVWVEVYHNYGSARNVIYNGAYGQTSFSGWRIS